MEATIPRALRIATIVWCVTPFVVFIAAPPVPFFCVPGEEDMFWYKAMSLGAVLSFPLCFGSVIAGRIAYGSGYQRFAYACMVAPAIGIAAYWLTVAGLRAYWGDEISCLVGLPHPVLRPNP